MHQNWFWFKLYRQQYGLRLSSFAVSLFCFFTFCIDTKTILYVASLHNVKVFNPIMHNHVLVFHNLCRRQNWIECWSPTLNPQCIIRIEKRMWWHNIWYCVITFFPFVAVYTCWFFTICREAKLDYLLLYHWIGNYHAVYKKNIFFQYRCIIFQTWKLLQT